MATTTTAAHRQSADWAQKFNWVFKNVNAARGALQERRGRSSRSWRSIKRERGREKRTPRGIFSLLLLRLFRRILNLEIRFQFQFHDIVLVAVVLPSRRLSEAYLTLFCLIAFYTFCFPGIFAVNHKINAGGQVEETGGSSGRHRGRQGHGRAVAFISTLHQHFQGNKIMNAAYDRRHLTYIIIIRTYFRPIKKSISTFVWAIKTSSPELPGDPVGKL